MGGMLPAADLPSNSAADLIAAREMLKGRDPGMFQMLAPFDHRAFAREWAQESPWLAGLSLPFAIPAYQAWKGLAQGTGLGEQDASPPSIDQLFAGYHGLAEGMLSHLPSAQAKGRPAPSSSQPR